MAVDSQVKERGRIKELNAHAKRASELIYICTHFHQALENLSETDPGEIWE